MIWPQPHENVSGINRTRDDLLSLDGAALARRAIMIEMAQTIYRLTLQCHGSQEGGDRFNRMRDPRMGDLVMETTSFWRLNDVEDSCHAFGILLGKRTEWASSDDEWNTWVAERREEGVELTDEDRATDTAWYVQYGSGASDICRWANADFVAIPVGMLYHTQEMQP